MINILNQFVYSKWINPLQKNANRPSHTRVPGRGRYTHKARRKRDLFSTIRYTTPCILQWLKGSWFSYVKNKYEASLQHLAIIHNIFKVQDRHPQVVRNFKSEKYSDDSVSEKPQVEICELIDQSYETRNFRSGKVYAKEKQVQCGLISVR